MRVADRIVGVRLGVFEVLAVGVLPEEVGTTGFLCCGVFGLWITLLSC